MQSGIYRFVNKRYRNLFLTASDDNDTVIGTFPNDSPNQLWEVICHVSAPPGACIIRSLGKGGLIGPLDGIVEDGIPVVVGQEARWTFAPDGPFVRIFIAGTDFNAQLRDGNPNTPVILGERNEGANQEWHAIHE